jgi:hypothetical protein
MALDDLNDLNGWNDLYDWNMLGLNLESRTLNFYYVYHSFYSKDEPEAIAKASSWCLF